MYPNNSSFRVNKSVKKSENIMVLVLTRHQYLNHIMDLRDRCYWILFFLIFCEKFFDQ